MVGWYFSHHISHYWYLKPVLYHSLCTCVCGVYSFYFASFQVFYFSFLTSYFNVFTNTNTDAIITKELLRIDLSFLLGLNNLGVRKSCFLFISRWNVSHFQWWPKHEECVRSKFALTCMDLKKNKQASVKERRSYEGLKQWLMGILLSLPRQSLFLQCNLENI